MEINSHATQYSRSPGLPAGESRVVNGPSATIGDLERHTNYSVSVAAATSAGVGAASRPINCATEEDGE